MLIPENILHFTIKSAIDLINVDWTSNSDKTKTILYQMLWKDDNGFRLQFNKFDYYEQGQFIFLKDQSSPRKLQVNIGYNLERAPLPTIHILLPEENNEEKGIGMGLGYRDNLVDEENNQYKETYTDVYRSSYNLMITSDNSSEVLLIYHVLKNFLFSITPHLEFMGLRDPKMGGRDLQFNNELVPPTIFHRNLIVSFFYESSTQSVNWLKYATKTEFYGIVTSSYSVKDNNV